jgi:hypothetical protein
MSTIAMDARRFVSFRSGFSAEQVVKWINDRTDVQIHIFRPPNYSGFLLVVLLVTMIGGLLYIKRNSLEFLYNQYVWGIFVIVSDSHRSPFVSDRAFQLAILICISGQIWNSIRGSPFLHRNPQTGQIVRDRRRRLECDDGDESLFAQGLFSGSSGYQFIAETYIVRLPATSRN